MEAPPRTGSYYFNHRKRHSIVFIAAGNSNYQFNMVDRSDVGPKSHGRVFSASNIARTLDEGLLNIAPPRCLYGENKLFPFVLVGDKGYNFTRINILHVRFSRFLNCTNFATHQI